MHEHNSGYGSYLWVWVIVIIIVISLIGIGFYYFSGGNAPLLAPRRRRIISSNAQGIQFPPENVSASVRLSGDQEVPPVKTHGKGKGKVVVDSDSREVYYDIHVKKLSSDIDKDIGVHFHVGDRGENGPIIKTLNIERSEDGKYYRFSGTWSSSDSNEALTQQDLDDLLSGKVYVNVHTIKYPDGEIRGQVSC